MTKPGSDALLERLSALHPKSIDLSLDRMWRLLARLDHPERRLPPVVHVAGTNGKGSLLAYLRTMLEAAGYGVHAYTSPHLVRFHERIRLAAPGGGRPIPEPELAQALDDCERANGDDPITYFEITTAAAFHVFAARPADVLLLETGLGGRLDATNVVERPALVALTPISHDHHQYLGARLGGIAAEKAAIIKAGVPAVVGPQPAVALDVIRRRAGEVGATLFRHGADWQAWAESGRLVWHGGDESLTLPLPALPGVHQIGNAGTAVACIRKLGGFTVSDEAVAAGLRGVEWPGRLQRLRHGPLIELAPAAAEVWLDGGHNPDAGRALAETLESNGLGDGTARPLHLIVGMLNSKEPGEFLKYLAPLARSAQCIAIPGEANALAAEALSRAATAAGLTAQPRRSLHAAMAAIAAEAANSPPIRVLICGSLYLAGRVLAENG